MINHLRQIGFLSDIYFYFQKIVFLVLFLLQSYDFTRVDYFYLLLSKTLLIKYNFYEMEEENLSLQ